MIFNVMKEGGVRSGDRKYWPSSFPAVRRFLLRAVLQSELSAAQRLQ